MVNYYVQVREIVGDKLEREIGPYASLRLAEKAEDGVLRQLNHERYFTDVEAREENNQNSVPNERSA